MLILRCLIFLVVIISSIANMPQAAIASSCDVSKAQAYEGPIPNAEDSVDFNREIKRWTIAAKMWQECVDSTSDKQKVERYQLKVEQSISMGLLMYKDGGSKEQIAKIKRSLLKDVVNSYRQISKSRDADGETKSQALKSMRYLQSRFEE